MLGKDRIKKKTDEELARIYEEGRIPKVGEITEKLREFGKQDLEAPEFKPPQFERMSRFDVGEFNKATELIKDDLDVLYDTDVGITAELIRQLNFHDISSRSQYTALRLAVADINDLLITQSAANGVLYSVCDDISDLSKVDLDNTTAGLDLNLGVATLPVNKAASRRLKLDKLADLAALPVFVVETPGVDIKHHGPVAGVFPGAVADNTLSSWGYRVFAKTDGSPVQIEVRLDLIDEGQVEPSFSRIDIEPFTWGEMDVEVLYTRDFQNWLLLPGYRDPSTTEGAPITFRFPTIRAKSLKLLLTKRQGSGTVKEGPVDVCYYHFGIRNIALYSMGYGVEGVFQSKLLTPSVDCEYTIDKVALVVDDRIPERTSIEYEVGIPTGDVADYTGKLRWARIAPVGRDTVGAPQILDLNSSSLSPRSKNMFCLTESAGTGIIDDVPFYNIYDADSLTGDIIPGTGKLWRGINAWHRKFGKQLKNDAVVVRGVQLRFNKDMEWQSLYIPVVDESPLDIGVGTASYEGELETPSTITGYDKDAELHLSHRVLLYGDDMTPVVPEWAISGVAPKGTNFPVASFKKANQAYSVQKVMHVHADSYEDIPLVLNTDGGLAYVRPRPMSYNMLTKGKGRHGSRQLLLGLPKKLDYLTSARVYLKYTTVTGRHIEGFYNIRHLKTLDSPDSGTDYVPGGVVGAISYFEIEQGKIRLEQPEITYPPPGQYPYYANIHWAIAQADITNLVTDVVGSSVFISKDYPLITQSARILVSYRRLLDYGHDTIQTRSLELSRTGLLAHTIAGSPAKFKEGEDYDVTPEGIVHAIGPNLLGGGGSGAGNTIKVEAKFNLVPGPRDVYVFSTYYRLEQPIKRLKLYNVCVGDYSPLSLDADNGDSLIVRAGGKTQDITASGELVDIPVGIVQVIVQSADLYGFYHELNKQSAIYKVLSAVDANGKPVFTCGSDFWTRQTAYVNPLQQVSFLNLTRNVYRTDRSFFAIQEGVWVNYEPWRESLMHEELLTITGEPPDVVGIRNPCFELEYRYRLQGATEDVRGMAIRATLKRDPGSDGDITPALSLYSLRFS